MGLSVFEKYRVVGRKEWVWSGEGERENKGEVNQTRRKEG